MLTLTYHDPALKWYEYTGNDAWWQSQMPISQAALANLLGMERSAFSKNFNEISTHTNRPIEKKLIKLIPDIERHAIVFPESGKGKTGVPIVLRIDPPLHPPLINRLAKESAWSLWAMCLACRFNKFLPIMLNGEPHVACYHCLPPSQYRAFGGTPVKKSLIHEALKKFY